MSIAQNLLASVMTRSNATSRRNASHSVEREHVRHAPTGDPRLDLALADLNYR